MSTVRSRRPLLTLVLLVVALASLPAHAQNGQPPVTPGDPRAVYIVVLNREKGRSLSSTKAGQSSSRAGRTAWWSNCRPKRLRRC